MRTIKFRGKRIDTLEWVYGWYAKGLFNLTNEVVEIDTIITRIGGYEVLPESVGQWTGKFDINGIEIYKGDIVNSGHLKSDEWIPSIAVIEWDDGFAMFYQSLKGVNNGLTQLMDVPCEIIGNVTDNPELMEVANEND